MRHVSRPFLKLLLVGALTALAPVAQASADARPFAPDSVWNLPLRADAPLSPKSGEYASWLERQVAGGRTWINTTHCGMPSYTAAGDTPLVQVHLDSRASQDPALINAWSHVPIPADAAPADCSDANFAVRQTQPDGRVKQWEFWAARHDADGTWTARWGGVIDDLRTDRGIGSSIAWSDPTAPLLAARKSSPYWNVTATSVSMSAGVITADDLRAGSIDHALAVALPDAARGQWLWPAQRSDGGLTDSSALPEGAHLRIDPSLDLDAIPMTPMVKMMAKAAQRYGMIVRDRTWDVTTFMTDRLTASDVQLFKDLLWSQWANRALQAFPWGHLQVLDAPMCTGAPCRVADRAAIDVGPQQPAEGQPVELDTTNSTLNYPRRTVRWDLDGDGVFETDGGTGVKLTLPPQSPGDHTVGVSIQTMDGTTVRKTSTFTVGTAAPQPPAGAPAPPDAAPPAAAGNAPAAAGAPAATSGRAPAALPASCGRVVAFTARTRTVRGRVHLDLSGRLAGARKACPLTVERAVGARWARVATTRTSAAGGYAFSGWLPGSQSTAKPRLRVTVAGSAATVRAR
jgi:hypothetical protein